MKLTNLISKNLLALLLVTISSVCLAQKTVITYIQTDHLGSPVLATHEDGSVKWREDYQPFGKQLATNATDNSVGFTGHLNEKVTGLTYMKGRWYHSEAGRFMALDPVLFRDVHSFNRYVYANNNPYRYVDPDGRLVSDRQLLINKGFSDLSSFNSTHTELLAEASGYNDTVDSVNAVMSGDFSGAGIKLAQVVLRPLKVIAKINNLIKKGCSFAPETLILTKDGYKSIVDVKIGDYVKAKNDVTGEVSWRQVTDTFKDWHEETITFSVIDENGLKEEIVTTEEHPFYVDGKGWLAAGDIKTGTIVSGPQTSDKISIADKIINAKPQYAHNFTVDADHTYFVGSTNMWVHNTCNFPDAKEMAKKLNTNKNDFHTNVKKEIKTDLAADVRKTGATNPDIGITESGNIALKNVKTNKIVETDVPLDSYARD